MRQKGVELERGAYPYCGCKIAFFSYPKGTKYVITNRAFSTVRANRATVKACPNDTLCNKTCQWIKKIYWVPMAKANVKACTKHYNWPRTQPLQRSSCLCSSHVSEVFSIHLTISNRGPGGKETSPACWGSSFLKTNADFTQRQLGPLNTETVEWSSERPIGSVYWNSSIYFGNLWIPTAGSL